MRQKVYGSYQQAKCLFCGKAATSKNKLGVSVCRDHTKTEGMEIMCTCGSWLELRDGKYGTFFLCENCGPISKSKALQMKEITAEQVKEETKTEETVKEEPKEINITTDDAEYF